MYTGTNEQLHDALVDRGLFVPSFEGKFDRKRAIRALQQWEISHPDKPNRICRVTFSYSRDPSASMKYVQATINGKKWVFPYEKEVEVPEYVLKECIDRAVREEFAPLNASDDAEPGKYKTIKTKIYPYMFHGYVETETKEQAETEVTA